jgi:hypothetical protein
MKTGQVWFSNGKFQLEMAMQTPEHFHPPSSFSVGH